MKKTTILIIIILLISTNGFSQELVLLSSNARTNAMGNVGINPSSDAFSLYDYGSIAAFGEKKINAGYSLGLWTPTSPSLLNTIALSAKASNRIAIMAGVRHILHYPIDMYNSYGEACGSFRPFDMMFDVGLGYAVARNIAINLNMRYVGGKLDGSEYAKTGSALGFDIGVCFRHKDFITALQFSNFGSKINYGGSDHSMPAEIKLAGGYTVNSTNYNQLFIAAEINYICLPKLYSGIEFGVGAEYIYANMYALMCGYRLGNDKGGGFGSSVSYATIGAGIIMNPFRINVSYVPFHHYSSIVNSVRLSIEYGF